MPDNPASPLKPQVFQRTGEKKISRLPAPDDPYEASALPDTHGIGCLVLATFRQGFKAGAVAYTSLQYVHIDLGEFVYGDDGQSFRLTFSGLQPKLVTVHGRNLARMYDQIGLHQLHWIREADRDFRRADMPDDGSEFISRIEIADWKRPKAQAQALAEALEAYEDA